MAIPDIKLQKVPGLGRKGRSQDAISAMIFVVAQDTTSLAFGDIVKVSSLIEAEQVYELDAAYDVSNTALVHHHIQRFFGRQPEGTLWIMLLEDDAVAGPTEQQIMDTHIPALLTTANHEVRQFAYFEGANVTPLAAFADRVEALQGICDDFFDDHGPVFACVGFEFSGTAAAAADLRALDHPAVAVCIAQDMDVAAIDAAYANYVALGDMLGHIAFARVNESIGWVGRFPLTIDLPSQKWFLRAALSSGLAIETYTTADIALLHDKGYIFARPHVGKIGYFWQSSPTCSLITSDEAYIENARTLNKSARVIRQALLDRLNSPVLLNDDGTIDGLVLTELEALAGSGLAVMQQEGEISAYNVEIDPSINFIGNGEIIDINFSVIPVGVARGINGKIKLVAKL